METRGRRGSADRRSRGPSTTSAGVTSTAALVALLLVASSAVAHAQSPAIYPDAAFSVGPGVGRLMGADPGWAYNLELTGTELIFSGTLNLRLVDLDSGERLYGPQVEAAAWYVANLGLGVGYLLGDRPGPTWHVFVGLPVGDDVIPEALRPFESGYIEPYYRLSGVGATGGELMHEVGLLLKITTYSI